MEIDEPSSTQESQSNLSAPSESQTPSQGNPPSTPIRSSTTSRHRGSSGGSFDYSPCSADNTPSSNKSNSSSFPNTPLTLSQSFSQTNENGAPLDSQHAAVSQGLLKLQASQAKNAKAIQASLLEIKKEIEKLRNSINSKGINGSYGGYEEGEGLSAEAKIILHNKINDVNNKITEQLKSYHVTISKYSKMLEKACEVPLEFAFPLSPSGSPEDPYLEVATSHLCRHGYKKTVQAIVNNSYIQLSDEEQLHLLMVSDIIMELKNGQVNNAEIWAKDNQANLPEGISKQLNYAFAKFNFFKLVISNNIQDALKLAQTTFPLYYDDNYDEIGQLMSCLLLLPHASSNSSLNFSTMSMETCSEIAALYPQLTYDNLRSLCTTLFIEAAAKCHKLPSKSHLSSLLEAAQLSDPAVRKHLSLHNQSLHKVQSLKELENIVIDYPATQDLAFHSVFSCPVSREVATPENPPVLLACGHAILKTSMKSLPKRVNKFKCPTCYHEMTPDDTMVLHI